MSETSLIYGVIGPLLVQAFAYLVLARKEGRDFAVGTLVVSYLVMVIFSLLGGWPGIDGFVMGVMFALLPVYGVIGLLKSFGQGMNRAMGIEDVPHQPKALVYEQFNPLMAIYERFLGERGFEVYVTRSMEEAWEYYEKESPELVVVKFESTQGSPSGVELLEKIRACGDERTPVMVVGHDITRNDEIRFLKLGGVRTLQQPFGKASIHTALDDLLTRKGLGRNSQPQPLC